jgi:hypothetical protein
MSDIKEKRGKVYKRVQVIFSGEQYRLIEFVRGKLGLSSDSETVKIIVLSWFAEKSIISSLLKGEFEIEVDVYGEKSKS